MSVNIGTLFGTLKLIDEFTPALQKVSRQWNQAASGMFAAGASITAGVTVPLIALGTHAVKTAVEFESAFARVRKSVEGTPEELKKIEQSLLNLAKTIPIPATELAKIAETGGQLGIGKDDIVQFTRVIADLAATTTLTGEEAATMMAKFQNIYGRAGKDMGRLASVVSELGNAGASTEADILQMGVRIASAGYQANITQGEVLAIANAIASLGVEAEAGGTSASRFIINMATAVQKGGSQLDNFAKMAGVSAATFKQAFEKDAASTMLTFFNALQDVKKESGNIITIMDDMGFHDVRLGNTIRALAGGGDQLSESLKNQSRAWIEGNTHAKRADIIYKTTAAQLAITRNQLNDVSRQLGNELTPILLQLATIARDYLIPALRFIVEVFAKLPAPVKAAIVAQLALMAAIGPLLVALGSMAMMVGGITSALPALAGGLGVVGGAASSLALGPLALVAAAIVAIGVGLNHLIKKWGDASVAASEAMGKDSQTAGRAFSFVRTQRSGGVISDDQMTQASKDLLELEKQLNEQRKLGLDLIDRGVSASWLKEHEQNVRNLTGQYDALAKAISNVNNERASMMGGVVGGSSTYTPPVVKKDAPKLDPPMTEEQLKSFNGLMEQLSRQAAGLKQVAAAYSISTAAGEARARTLEIETQALAAAQQYEGTYRDKVIASTRAVALLNDEAENAGRLAALNQEASDLDQLEIAYRSGADAVAKMRKKLEEDAAARQAVGKATGDMKTRLDQAARSNFWRVSKNAFSDMLEDLRDNNAQLVKMSKFYLDGTMSLSKMNRELQLQAEIKRATLGLDDDQKKKIEEEIRANAVLSDGLQQIASYRASMRKLGDEMARVTAEINLKPSDFKTWNDFNDALKRSQGELRIEAEFLQDVADMGVMLATKMAALNKELLDKQLANDKSKREDLGPWMDQMAEGALVIAAAADKIDSAFGRVVSTIAKGVAEIAKAEKASDKWVAAIQMASAVAMEFAPETTSGGFGGKGQTNYAGIGSVVGSVIGAVLAAVFTWGMGTSGGAAIGSAIGGAVGSFIVSGADEALGKIQWGSTSGALSSSFQTLVSTSEAGLGIVLEDLGRSIDRQIKGLLDAIGGTIASAAAMDVKVRDGVISVFVAGVVGRFKSMDEAVSFAVTELLKNSNIIGLSDTIKQILSKTSADSLDDLAEDLNFGMWYDALGIGEIGAQIQVAMADLRTKLRQAVEFGLDIGPVIEAAFKNFEGLKEQLLGIDTSTAKALEGLASYQLGVQATTDQLMKGLAEAQAALAATIAAQMVIPANTGGVALAGTNNLPNAIPGLQAAIDAYLAQLEAIPKALSEMEINMGIFDALEKYLPKSKKYEEMRLKFAKMKLEIEFAAIKAQLILMNKWEEFSQTFTDAYNNAMHLLTRPPGKGGGKKQDVRDFIQDKTFDLATAGLGPFMKSLADITKEYDEQLKNAGKDKDLRAKLLALKEQEIRLLQMQIKTDLIKPYQGGDFSANRSDFTRQMEEINKQYDDARAVYTALGLPLGALNRAEKERLELLGLQAAASVGSRTAATILEFRTLGQTMNFLKKNAADLGVNFGALLKEIQDTQFLATGDRLIGFVDKYYAGAKGFEQIRLKLEQTRFMLELNNMKLQFQLQKQLGLLTAEQIAMMQGVFDFIDATPVDWDAFFGTGSAVDQLGASASAAGDSIDSLAERFARAKDDLREFLLGLDRGEMGLVSPQDALNAAMQQYQDILTRSRAGDINAYEQLDEVGANYIEALKNASPILAAVQLPIIRAELGRMLSMNTVHDGNVTYTERFVQGQTQGNNIMTAGFSDLSSHASEQRAISLLHLDELKKISTQNVNIAAEFASWRDAKAAAKQGA